MLGLALSNFDNSAVKRPLQKAAGASHTTHPRHEQPSFPQPLQNLAKSFSDDPGRPAISAKGFDSSQKFGSWDLDVIPKVAQAHVRSLSHLPSAGVLVVRFAVYT
eukprot:1726553-Amphidinium_carterae.1